MVDGVKIYLNQWNDNRVVSTLSNFVGAAPEKEVRRFQRKTKTYINIKRPKCIELYNKGMGGVDLMDSLLGYYRKDLKSTKWYFKTFFHILDMVVVNAWIIQRRNREDS